MVKRQKPKRKRKKKAEVIKDKPVDSSLVQAREQMTKMVKLAEEKADKEKKIKYAIGAGGQLLPLGLSFDEMDLTARERIVQNMMRNTLAHKLNLWMVNLRENIKLGYVGPDGKSTDIREILKREGRSAICIGNGPSLYDFKHAQQIANAINTEAFEGLVICADSALMECVRNGLIPDYVCSTDGDPTRIHQFYNYELIQRLCAGKTKAVLMNTVSFNVFKKVEELGLDIITFGGFYDNVQELDSISRALHFMSGNSLMTVGGNVGAWNWHYGLFLDCKPVGLVGMDYSYRKDTPIEATAYYPHLNYALKGNMKEIRKRFRIVKIPYWKTEVLVDGLWEGYRDLFLRYARLVKPKGVITYNCTGSGILFDKKEKSVVQMQLNTFLKKYGVWNPDQKQEDTQNQA